MSANGSALPPWDSSLVAVLESLSNVMAGVGLSQSTLEESRTAWFVPRPNPGVLEHGGTVRVEEVTIPVDGGAHAIDLVVLSPTRLTEPRPALLSIHGGGMVVGLKWDLTEVLSSWVAEMGIIAVTVQYRLAPEHPHPAPVADCFAALQWVFDNAADLGVDRSRIMVHGQSAGGGLAAGVALMARDLGGPAISHQILECPMLDDRLRTESSNLLDGEGVWDRESNVFGWSSLLGDARGGPDVSIYAAPARAEDLTGLPKTYLDCGQVEVFRDEIIDYGSRLTAAGVSVEFHMWPGAFHNFDAIIPDSPLSAMALAVRADFVRRETDSAQSTE